MKKLVFKKDKIKPSISKKKSIDLVFDSKIYPLEAIYIASYIFIDNFYIFLDGDPNSKIKVKLTPKTNNSSSNQNLNNTKEEFLNELLNCTLRYRISKENKNLREFILGTALLGSVGKLNPSEDFFEDERSLAKELEQLQAADEIISDENEDENGVVFDDPLGIAVPWEEKFKNNKEKTHSAKTPLKESKKSKK